MAAKKTTAKKTTAKKTAAKKTAAKKTTAKKTTAKKTAAKKTAAKKTAAKKTTAKKTTAKKTTAKKTTAKKTTAKKTAAKKTAAKKTAAKKTAPLAPGRKLPAIGKKAPDFTLDSSEGHPISLSDYAGKWVVLYFYPKDNTPGCTLEAKAFRDAAKRLKKLGAVVLGVSKDSVKSHCRFRDKYDLNFPLLSDPEQKALSAYGAWGEKRNYGKVYQGIIRSTFLIDPEGKLVRAWPNVRVAGHVDEVIAALEEEAAAR